MRLDNIFVPKQNGLGWTLNGDNPISWIILLVIIAIASYYLYPKLRNIYYYYKNK